jgi:hypothetical protein
MKAMNLIRRSSYGPERLKQIYQAFDRAWEAIRPLVDDNRLAHEAARLTLANAILSVAKDDLGDRGSPRTAAPADVASIPPTKQSC